MSEAPEHSGDLAELPLPRLLLQLHRCAFSGSLRLEGGDARKNIDWAEGAPFSVESSLESEELCELLVSSGVIGEADAVRSRNEALQRGCQVAAVLVGLELLEPKALLSALKSRVSLSLVEAIGWPAGRYELDPAVDTPSNATALRNDPLRIVQRGLVAHWGSQRLADSLLAQSDDHPVPTTEGAASLRKLAGPQRDVLRALVLLDGKRSFEKVIAAVSGSPQALAALWTACECGWIEYRAAATPSAQDVASSAAVEIEVAGAATPTANASPAARAGADKQRARDDNGVGKEIESYHERLDEIDHYELLGVERDAKPAQIKKAYFKAAKRFHPDKLARLGLDDIAEQAAEVFARFAEAHETLGDPERRSAYDEMLAGGGSDSEIDLARLTQAEGFFRKGEVLVKMGDFRGAAELLQTATELWTDESIYHGTLGWALLRKTPSEPEAARAALERALELDSQSAQSHFWMSHVQRRLGNVKAADMALSNARSLDPQIGS